MNENNGKSTGERIFCVLTSPTEEGQPFKVSVYAVGADRPHCILRATSPRSELLSFLKLVQESGYIPEMSGKSSCAAEM